MATFDGGGSHRQQHLRLVIAYRHPELSDDEIDDDLDSGVGCVGPTLLVVIALCGVFWLGVITVILRFFF